MVRKKIIAVCYVLCEEVNPYMQTSVSRGGIAVGIGVGPPLLTNKARFADTSVITRAANRKYDGVKAALSWLST